MNRRKIVWKLKGIIERFLRLHILRWSQHGHHDCDDIKRTGVSINTIFDIGANVGDVSIWYINKFPSSRIYSFEPVTSTFKELAENCSSYPQITCYKLAMGSEPGKADIHLSADSSGCSMLHTSSTIGSESVEVTTIDKFANENRINCIDLVKIDTEGFDLEVLRGAHGMLSRNKISFVLVEVGFLPNDIRHAFIEDVRGFLYSYGFAPFGIYEQHLEWSGKLRLRFANVCFVNEKAAFAE